MRTADGRAMPTPTIMTSLRHPLTAAVGLLLSLLAGLGLATFPTAQRVHDQRLELLRFVLHRDSAWRLILDQRIKLTDNDRTSYDRDASVDVDLRARLRLVDDGASKVAPLPIIQSVLRDFAWLGSHVAYAAHVLHRALSCVVHVHVSHVIEILEALEMKTEEALKLKAVEKAIDNGDKNAVPLVLEKEARKALEEEVEDQFAHDVKPFRMTFRTAWATIAMLADKLAAVGGRLSLLADLSNMLSKALVLREVIPFPVVKLMRYEIDKMIESRCDRHQPVDVYLELGFSRVKGEPFGVKSTPAGLKLSIGQLTQRLHQFYGSLQIESIPMENWAQVFNYQMANTNEVKLHSIIDEILEQHPMNDKIKRMRRENEKKLLEEFAREKLKEENLDV